jgi:hypothetical protein
MKPKIRFYKTIGKPKSATITIGKVKIYLHDIEWETPRELWFTVTCPELDIDPYAHVIYAKHKVLSSNLFGGNIDKIEIPYENKISKKTYRDVIRKVFTSDKFVNNYMSILLDKIYYIDHIVTDTENIIVNLQEKIAKLRDKQSKLMDSQIRL